MPLPDLRIAQALLVVSPREVRVAAQSDDLDAAEAERIAVLFGIPPSGVAFPLAHFAQPFGRRHVAVVQVTDPPGTPEWTFRFLVLSADLYRHLGDPFAVADRFPPDWSVRGPLPVLEWPPEPLPPRTTTELQDVLKACDPATEEMALLLGSTQVLVDGGRVQLLRPEPAERFLRALWKLLPHKARAGLWPASFVFGPGLHFDAAVRPMLWPGEAGVRLTEDGLKGYPQGNYESRLQAAVEAGDDRELAALLARRTGDDTLRIGLTIIAAALLAAVAFKVLG
ncbi:hypothetical protein [Urbifossiella limnaea]|uniref:Uncharacterized protein n=1 Tax=Urbifossiella limnaea TaxID=2528023 RepID=A0A517XNG1_9BACT|nr:hypothetical protein [Urbifossiella limnaea]QDU19045.1 hypothetical protein ETAA1_09480 [Urbifossiella limnaea]